MAIAFDRYALFPKNWIQAIFWLPMLIVFGILISCVLFLEWYDQLEERKKKVLVCSTK
jgi:hypothetical protein